PVWLYDGFAMMGQQMARPDVTQAIPPLVLSQPVIPPVPPEVFAVGASGGDPVGLQRYLAQGTGINAALPALGTVMYQGQLITATGSIAPGARAAGVSEEGGLR